ncbi:uncharacterized protein EDB91DRAFT_1087258 [Suillus paluster]|uniref:uncharacterized protein n=1 Tax=Suillus paluster TaxID=48578 RepID=UPI001B85F6FF|nr:uncharacterized protein EDB91DRAFT_1087258 [Suillus paluster]KAG1725081.1 hypothetical protein EDB91DRAFT_1087258 [Suillus paluster]
MREGLEDRPRSILLEKLHPKNLAIPPLVEVNTSEWSIGRPGRELKVWGVITSLPLTFHSIALDDSQAIPAIELSEQSNLLVALIKRWAYGNEKEVGEESAFRGRTRKSQALTFGVHTMDVSTNALTRHSPILEGHILIDNGTLYNGNYPIIPKRPNVLNLDIDEYWDLRDIWKGMEAMVPVKKGKVTPIDELNFSQMMLGKIFPQHPRSIQLSQT